MITYTEKRFGEIYQDDVAVTIRNSGGTYGGGSEVFVVQTLSEASPDAITRESATNMSRTESW